MSPALLFISLSVTSKSRVGSGSHIWIPRLPCSPNIHTSSIQWSSSNYRTARSSFLALADFITASILKPFPLFCAPTVALRQPQFGAFHSNPSPSSAELAKQSTGLADKNHLVDLSRTWAGKNLSVFPNKRMEFRFKKNNSTIFVLGTWLKHIILRNYE